MLEQYSLSMPKAVYSGKGALGRIREITEGKFKKAAVFTDKGVEQAGLLEIPMEQLKAAGVDTEIITDLPAEPSCDEAQDRSRLNCGSRRRKRYGCGKAGLHCGR